ncbi:26S proteasome non-ATPase regulatory subunit 9-like [Dysidea avara]|uniref:26S proteasome non-ATPase regulatory subunit 9-like n=1 Tax=Dysidea avara TaxID=196820 RepID=UPI00332C2382
MEPDIEEWKGLTAQELMDKKDGIEEEIKSLHEELENQGQVGTTGSLVDKDGYPRDDIDIYAVRMARNKVIRLQNDHKSIMKLIEEKIHQLHEEARRHRVASEGDDAADKVAAKSAPKLPSGFAKINQVSSGSPAQLAGLAVGDTLVEFGSVSGRNFNTLQDVARVVQHSKNSPVNVVIVRNGKVKDFTLIPKVWSGAGLLGCNIVPLSAIR